jgi:hypothetical protein
MFEVNQSEGGLLIAVKRAIDSEKCYWRITPWIMPWYTIIPPYGENALRGHGWVPIDDENCIVWTWAHHPTRPLEEAELHAMKNEDGAFAALIPGTFTPVANKRNDYLIDREGQKSGRYFSGVKGIAMQDGLSHEIFPLIGAILMLAAAAVLLLQSLGDHLGDTATVEAIRQALNSALALDDATASKALAEIEEKLMYENLQDQHVKLLEEKEIEKAAELKRRIMQEKQTRDKQLNEDKFRRKVEQKQTHTQEVALVKRL